MNWSVQAQKGLAKDVSHWVLEAFRSHMRITCLASSARYKYLSVRKAYVLINRLTRPELDEAMPNHELEYASLKKVG